MQHQLTAERRGGAYPVKILVTGMRRGVRYSRQGHREGNRCILNNYSIYNMHACMVLSWGAGKAGVEHRHKQRHVLERGKWHNGERKEVGRVHMGKPETAGRGHLFVTSQRGQSTRNGVP